MISSVPIIICSKAKYAVRRGTVHTTDVRFRDDLAKSHRWWWRRKALYTFQLVDVPLSLSFPATCLFLRPRKEQFHQPYCIMLLVMLAPALLLYYPIYCLYRKFDSVIIPQYGAAMTLYYHLSHNNTVTLYTLFPTVRLFSLSITLLLVMTTVQLQCWCSLQF